MDIDRVLKRLRRSANTEVSQGVPNDDIERAERMLGVPIKGGYRAFLSEFGWGSVEYFEIFGLGAGIPVYLNLVQVTLSERNEAIPALRVELLPIANDGWGNLYCLDSSRGDEPPVVFWNHELTADQSAEHVADSFADWLNEELERSSC